MLDTETTQRIATEAVHAAVRQADADRLDGRGYADITDHERTLLADFAAHMAHRSPLIQRVTQGKPAAERDVAEVIWRFAFGRSYLLHLADLAGEGNSGQPRDAQALVSESLTALDAVWRARDSGQVT
jgi:hypothetical protein